MAYTTNQKFANDKKISLIDPTYTREEEKYFFKSIFGDPRRYLQVLVNFVNNAVKFTTNGGSVSILLVLVDIANYQDKNNIIKESPEDSTVRPASPVKEHDDQDSQSGEEKKLLEGDICMVDINFKIIVRDTGVGISEANQEKLF